MVPAVREGGRVLSCMVMRVWPLLQRLPSPGFSFGSTAHRLPPPQQPQVPLPPRPVAPLGQGGTLLAPALAQATGESW